MVNAFNILNGGCGMCFGLPDRFAVVPEFVIRVHRTLMANRDSGLECMLAGPVRPSLGTLELSPVLLNRMYLSNCHINENLDRLLRTIHLI